MVVSSDTSKWYVVHCHSGFEKKVADAILDEAKKVELEDLINEVSVPTQAVVEVRRGVRVNSEKKFFPGYVLVKMVMNDDTWHLVRDIPKVSNFLGTKDKPIAISEREVSKLLQDITEGVDNPKPKFEYEVGEQIKVSFLEGQVTLDTSCRTSLKYLAGLNFMIKTGRSGRHRTRNLRFWRPAL